MAVPDIMDNSRLGGLVRSSRVIEGDSDWIYWITGKPGAGRSTLITFFLRDQRLGRLLEQWAGDLGLPLGSYYSWNAGNSLQKSHEGLLRTLLYQCLSQKNPDLLVSARQPIQARDTTERRRSISKSSRRTSILI
jgi:hypothetical protein